MPFAHLAGDVASGFEAFCEGHFGDGQGALAIVIHAEALLITTGDDTRSRWHTLWCTHIAMGKANPVADECVEIGGLDVFIYALGTEIGEAVVIAVNQDDVGLCGRCGVDEAG